MESFGLGSVRTLKEYEDYAGLSFRLRKAQDYTVLCKEPPNPDAAFNWAGKIYTWMVRIALDRVALPTGALEDPTFWYIGVNGEDGAEIYRKDISKEQLDTLPSGQSELVIVCEFQSGSIPATWIVWPVSRSKGWLRKVEGRLLDGDYTIILEDNLNEEDHAPEAAIAASER
jgi:hypothetical protein